MPFENISKEHQLLIQFSIIDIMIAPMEESLIMLYILRAWGTDYLYAGIIPYNFIEK